MPTYKNLAVCEMSFWTFAVLEDRERILCLDISLGSDQLKDAVENIGKDDKLLGKQLDLCKVYFLIGREKEVKFLLIDWIKSLKKNIIAIIQDWDSLLSSKFCAEI